MKSTRHKNMTWRWKLKTNSSNIFLVLMSLMLTNTECVKGEPKDFEGDTNFIENTTDENQRNQTQIYIGNDEIAEYFFRPSTNDSSALEGINKCLENFQLITCVKMLLLTKINEVVGLMEESNAMQKDVNLLNGLFIFKVKNKTINSGEEKSDDLSLDEEIAFKVKRIFRKRSLLVNFLPRFKIEIEPAPEQNPDDFVCFNYTIQKESEVKDKIGGHLDEGRKKKGGGMPMMMIVPQMIMLGLMPFTLASLKAMVMNAVMINMMALNGAIFMTIRNLVFGPREGDNVKYANYGYSKDRQTQSRRPVLIIHSPAAFVKQPPVHKKTFHKHSSQNYMQHSYFPESQYISDGNSHLYHHQKAETVQDYEDNFYYIQQSENEHGKQEQTIQRRNNYGHLGGFTKHNDTRQVPRIKNYKTKNYITKSYQTVNKPKAKKPNENQPNFNSYPYEDVKTNSHLVRQRIAQIGGVEFKSSPKWNGFATEKL